MFAAGGDVAEIKRGANPYTSVDWCCDSGDLLAFQTSCLLCSLRKSSVTFDNSHHHHLDDVLEPSRFLFKVNSQNVHLSTSPPHA